MSILAAVPVPLAPAGVILDLGQARLRHDANVAGQLNEVDLGVSLPKGYSLAVYTNRMDSQTARGVASLFKEFYGSKYYPEVTENPGWLQQQVKEGYWKAFVIKNAFGEVVAHAALLKEGAGEYTFARLLKQRDLPIKGVSEKLTQARDNFLAQGPGAAFVFSEAVTHDVASQRNLAKFGFEVLGLRPAKFPQRFGPSDHGTMVSLGRVDGRARLAERTNFLPVAYQAMAEMITEALGCDRNYQVRGEATCSDEPSIAISDEKFAQYGISELTVANSVSTEAMLAAVSSKQQDGARFVSVAVPLSSPEAVGQIESLRKAGFCFSMLTPEADQDVLTMQWTREGAKEALEALQPHSGMAFKLKRMILALDFKTV